MKVDIVDDDHSNSLLFLRGGHSGRAGGGIVALPEHQHCILRVHDVAPFVDQQHAFAVLGDDERYVAIAGALLRWHVGSGWSLRMGFLA